MGVQIHAHACIQIKCLHGNCKLNREWSNGWTYVSITWHHTGSTTNNLFSNQTTAQHHATYTALPPPPTQLSTDASTNMSVRPHNLEWLIPVCFINCLLTTTQLSDVSNKHGLKVTTTTMVAKVQVWWQHTSTMHSTHHITRYRITAKIQQCVCTTPALVIYCNLRNSKHSIV